MKEELVGKVSHYFGKVQVAGIKLSDELRVGDTIEFRGFTTDLRQRVTSMQIDREDVEVASAESEVGIKVSDRVRVGDRVFRLTDEE